MVWVALVELAKKKGTSPESLGRQLKASGVKMRRVHGRAEYWIEEPLPTATEPLPEPLPTTTKPLPKPLPTTTRTTTKKQGSHMIRVSDEVHDKLQAEAGKLAVKREARVSLSDVIEAKFNALKAMGFFRKPKKAVEEEPAVVERKEII